MGGLLILSVQERVHLFRHRLERLNDLFEVRLGETL